MRRGAIGRILTFALALCAAPLTSDAQQAGRPYRIGVLHEGYSPVA